MPFLTLRWKNYFFKMFGASAALLFLMMVAGAQIPQGGLVGAVADSTGARVAGASVTVSDLATSFERSTTANSMGEFRLESLKPGTYRVTVTASGFAQTVMDVTIAVGATPTLRIALSPTEVKEVVQVKAQETTLASQPIETTSSVEKTTIGAQDLASLPLSSRSFANIAYLAPMTEPVEPSDPTKARITAVSFGGSSGLNVDLSIDGGDNNDDYIGGFLQNFSPEAIQEFTVRTAQFDADTSHTNGGSVIISTRRGTDEYHLDLAAFFRARALNARNELDNPDPNPKQPFSRENGIFAFGGPIKKSKLNFFTSFEYVHEDASVAYSANSLNEFQSLAQLAAQGLIPGINSIPFSSSTNVPFREKIFNIRFDYTQSARSQWFLRGSIDRYTTRNDLVQQGTLASTGAFTDSKYYNILLSNTFQFSPNWLGIFTSEASLFRNDKVRNSDLGIALAFPFSSTTITTSGFETFGDNQFVTPITAFPIKRLQQKYQFRYDVTHAASAHSVKFGVNLIHEPVLSGRIADSQELLVAFPSDPSFYITNPAQFVSDFAAGSTFMPASDGAFVQSVRRLGLYAQDSWRINPNFTINYGLRYDTTFGLFRTIIADSLLRDWASPTRPAAPVAP
jgi:hypothetical protein